MRLGIHLECVGSSLRVSGVCQDSAREFIRRRPRLARRLSRVAEKLAGTYASAQGLDDAMGARWEFARIMPKVSGRSLGTRWEITGGRL
ncbi:hypothetical protein GW17_00061220 [Ensete ventricosum]|nr:hypothetical protein GW17_00061220 [Ensete ventricosum]